MEDRKIVIQKLNKAVDLASKQIGVTRDKIRTAIGYTKPPDSYSTKKLFKMAINVIQAIKSTKEAIRRK